MNPLEDLVDPKIKRILTILLANRTRLHHLQQISAEAKVPLATTFRLVKKLVKLQFIEIIQVGKLKIYRLADNQKTRHLTFGGSRK